MIDEASEQSPAAPPKNTWAERLRGRGRMAAAVIGGLLVVGIMGSANPLLDRTASAKARLKKAETRSALGDEVANLRKQAALYQKKLPVGVDLNDWTNYLIRGISAERVKLIRMDPKDQATLGPCKVLTWLIDMEGDYQSLARVVAWLENGERLVRIDHMVVQTPNGKLSMNLIVRGLALDKAPAAPTPVAAKPPRPTTTTAPTTRASRNRTK